MILTPQNIDELVRTHPDKVLEILSDSNAHDEFWSKFEQWSDEQNWHECSGCGCGTLHGVCKDCEEDE